MINTQGDFNLSKEAIAFLFKCIKKYQGASFTTNGQGEVISYILKNGRQAFLTKEHIEWLPATLYYQEHFGTTKEWDRTTEYLPPTAKEVKDAKTLLLDRITALKAKVKVLEEEYIVKYTGNL